MKSPTKIMEQLRQIPGLVDLRVQQPFDYPTLNIAVDRTKAMQGGFTQENVATSVLNTLSGSLQVTPMYLPELEERRRPTISSRRRRNTASIPCRICRIFRLPLPAGQRPASWPTSAAVDHGSEMAAVSHYNIRRVIDIYGAVQDRDLGAVGRDVQRMVDDNTKLLPRGTFIHVRGQLETMQSSYVGLLIGLGFAIVLIYLLIVVNFQSWLDPFIIITALPAALAGIVLMLFFTHTTLSVPALMGAIMCMGVATANSILVVTFARERLRHHDNAVQAAIEAGATRFRPVHHDRPGHDHRHGADGAGPGRRRRAKRAPGPRGDRRFALRDHRHAYFCSRRLQPAARRRKGRNATARAPLAPPPRRTHPRRSHDMTTTPNKALGPNAVKSQKPAAPPQPKKSGGWLGWMVVLILAAGIGVAIYYGIRSRVQAAATLEQVTHADAVPFVSVIHPTPGAASTELALPGSTQAFISTPIFARTNGYLKAWYADIGAHVKQGELLAVIETPELDQQLQQSQADLKNAQANLEISAATNKRYQDLVASNSVSREEADTTAADLRSKQAMVDSGEANVRRLQQLQDYEKIYAPFDGVITVRNIDIGDLVQSSDTRELFHLASIDRLRIYVSVPEVYAPLVSDGEKVPLTVDSFPGETFTGTVARNSDSIDPTTRTLNVEVDVDNPTGKLLPGAYVFAHFKFPSTAGSVTVPSTTLLFRSEGPRVGVVRDGQARLVPITIGHDYGTSLEILSGLSAADNVIVDPSDSLADGMPVQITQPKTTAP